MSKVTKVYNGNYKLEVQDGGTITLDTGDTVGTVVVTGDLEVKGTTTTVESTEVTISDNILVLSSGTVGSGIPSSLGYVSGIEIDRGSYSNAKWLFDEQVSWTLGGTSGQGTFYADAGGQKLPLNTPGIVANGNLYVYTGNGVISVTNTSDYEEKIFNYDSGVIAPAGDGTLVIDDDHIPNAKSIVDYFDYAFTNILVDNISTGDTRVETIDQVHVLDAITAVTTDGTSTIIRTAGLHGFTVADTIDISGVSAGGDAIENLNGTGITILDVPAANLLKVARDTTGGNASNYVPNSGTISKTGAVESRVKVQVSGTEISNFYENRIELGNLEIRDTIISTTASNQDLEIVAPGTGTIKLRDVVEIPTTPGDDDPATDPLAPDDGVRIYSKSQGTGKVGLYYVNSNNTTDELISKNRSLLFSMLF